MHFYYITCASEIEASARKTHYNRGGDCVSAATLSKPRNMHNVCIVALEMGHIITCGMANAEHLHSQTCIPSEPNLALKRVARALDYAGAQIAIK